MTFVCNECKVITKDNKKRYNMDLMNIDGVRLFERRSIHGRYETKHLVERSEVNLCSKECLHKFIAKQMNSFISEIKPEEFKEEIVLF